MPRPLVFWKTRTKQFQGSLPKPNCSQYPVPLVPSASYQEGPQSIGILAVQDHKAQRKTTPVLKMWSQPSEALSSTFHVEMWHEMCPWLGLLVSLLKCDMNYTKYKWSLGLFGFFVGESYTRAEKHSGWADDKTSGQASGRMWPTGRYQVRLQKMSPEFL